MRINLSRRFTFYIGGILLAGISAFHHMEKRSHSALIEEMGAGEARKLSAAVFDQLHTSMKLGGGNDENSAVLERFRRIPGIEEIRVIHNQAANSAHAAGGHMEAGFDRTDMGGAPADELEKLALAGTASERTEISGEGHRLARHVLPVLVTGECLACHGGWEAGSVTGAVSVSVSLRDHERVIESHRDVFMIWGGGIFLAATLAVFALVKKRLLMPLTKLREGAEAISNGRLDFRVGLRTGDELEQVAESFDRMAETLIKATADLRDLGEKYSKLVSTAADTIVLRDMESGKYTDANPAASALLGYSKDELLGMAAEDLFPPEDIRPYLSSDYGWADGGGGRLKELLVRRKDGALVPVEVAASILELNGRKYIQEIWRDISERRALEETIKRHVHELEETVRSRTSELDCSLRELRDAYAKLKSSEQKFIQSAKLISLGEMGAGIAHELNSPLAGILSITEVLMRRTGKDDPKYFLLDKIRDAAVRSKYIIMDVLTYSRPSRADYAPMFLNEAIRATLTIFISEIKTRSIEIIEDFDPTLPKVYGNKGQVMEVVLNILKNARDAIGGKGSIFISTRTVEADGKTYSLAEFRDTGPGVPGDMKDKVFDPFFTTKEKGGGNNIGLGLSISQSILKEHGGRIEVDNNPFGGAVFRVYLPVFLEK
ncbi:MAG: PAS domain S-box protein [Deltaproteobacteria bacterium]|nr:PAS domain S-box protein [Deltaproteobacteria bacterium]MBZ0218919.1 PAS domain S-box protein [Deltaproteobacteria bacterium]